MPSSRTTLALTALFLTANLLSCGKTNDPVSTAPKPPIRLSITSISPTHGPGGTLDTITGSGFDQLPDLDSVFLNGKNLVVNSRTPTQLVVAISRLAGSGNIGIRTTNGIFSTPRFNYDTVTTIVTIAGSGAQGFVDGPAGSASFYGPLGIVLDKKGNIFVADAICIRKITPDGNVSTFAGSTTVEGSADGHGTAATFGNLYGLAIDQQDNMYVADVNNNKIRMVTPAGDVTTLAGSGNYFLTDGTAATATFSSPYWVAVDSQYNVYVADEANNVVRKIAAGWVSTIAGGGYYKFGYQDGPGASALFFNPSNIAMSPWTKNLYVMDAYGFIRKITTPGYIVSTVGGPNGAELKPAMSFGNGMAIDKNENLYVTNGSTGGIYKIDTAGNVKLFAGWGIGDNDGPYPIGRFRNPYGLAIDTAGNLYVTDAGNQKVKEVKVQ